MQKKFWADLLEVTNQEHKKVMVLVLQSQRVTPKYVTVNLRLYWTEICSKQS